MSLTGSGCSKMALTTVKIVVFAPIPSASDKIATALKPGLLRSTRAPCRTSCQKYSIFHPGRTHDFEDGSVSLCLLQAKGKQRRCGPKTCRNIRRLDAWT